MEITEQDIIEITENDINSELTALYEAIGAKAVIDLLSVFSGCTIYIPQLAKIQRYKRDKLIKQDYFEKGQSISQLTKKYAVSDRTIYTVIKSK